MKKTIISSILLAFAAQASAQVALAENSLPTIAVPHKQTISYAERTLSIDVVANVDYTVTDDASWIETKIGNDGKVYIHATANPEITSRAGNVTFANEAHGITETFTIVQGRNESVETVPGDILIIPSGGSVNSQQGSSGWDKTIDGDINSMWHTAWSGFNVSESNPAILEYQFSDVESIEYINYIPRSGGGNGCFGLVDVYTKCYGDSDYVLYASYDWKGAGSARTIKFEGGLKKPRAIKFVIKSGAGNFASCAEMQFGAKNPETEACFSIFADDLLTTLKEGTTQTDIDNVENDFSRLLAQKIFDGTYSTEYRVASYEPYVHYDVLTALWCTSGKR